MDKTTNINSKILTDIKNYIMSLNKNNFKINKAILYGSHAKGNYNEYSDIDLALVSDSFEGNRYSDLIKIAPITIKINSDISPMPYNTKDFEEGDPFINEIKRTGIEIKV